MMPLEKLEGRTFGRLTVLPLVKMRPTMWLCKCTCGNELYVRSATLKSGASKSCGCLQKELARAARIAQGRNTSANKRITFNGVTQTQSAWAAQLGVDDSVIMRRLNAGWPLADALTKPLRLSRRNPSPLPKKRKEESRL